MFTSLKYWNSFSYAESLVFSQQYSAKIIKQTTKSIDRYLRSLVLNFSSFRVAHTRAHRFTGPPKGGTKYTLHVIFQKTWVQFKGQQSEFEKFVIQSKPISCVILEQEEILEFHQNSHYTGPTTEFLIKGDNFLDFQKVRDAFMNLKLPNLKASAGTHVINIHSECLEVLQKAPESDKFLIKFGIWAADISPYFLYG